MCVCVHICTYICIHTCVYVYEDMQTPTHGLAHARTHTLRYNNEPAAEQDKIMKNLAENLAEITGVDRTAINVTATASANSMTCTFNINASSASQVPFPAKAKIRSYARA